MAVATVIIPCGSRHVHLLPRAIESAERQTLPVKVMYLVDEDRRGPGWARNRMAERVDTPFIIQLDADDYLLPHFVEVSLRYWERGSYTYSDWFEGQYHVVATSCYGLSRTTLPNQRTFHLPPTLFPTRFWKAIGGYDESLFGAEDTDFYFKANTKGIRSIHIKEPLFHYTGDGFRAKEAAASQKWPDLLREIFGRYKGKMNMGCCGDVKVPVKNPGEKQENDVYARFLRGGRSRVYGAVSGRFYGRIGAPWSGWVDPRDAKAQPSLWEVLPNVEALSPTQGEIKQGLMMLPEVDAHRAEQIRQAYKDEFQSVPTDAPLDTIEAIQARIIERGVRTDYKNYKAGTGYDIQQDPYELAAFLKRMIDKGVKTVLEIGTGESGGLARFMAADLGWKVTSIDLNAPKKIVPGVKFIQANSASAEAKRALGDQTFDLVFIDGDHTYEGVKADHENHDQRGLKVVAFHDVSSQEEYAEGVRRYWKEIAYTKAGKLRSTYNEVGDQFGIGWYERA